MNLLDYFVLHHAQISGLHAELVKPKKGSGTQEAKVELNLTPRLMKSDSSEALPAYQVSARLTCRGGTDQDKTPMFTAQVGIETIYQQISGDPVDLAQFTSHHASLTRQLYPLLQYELRGLLMRLGLENINLPFDLAARVDKTTSESVQVSGAVH